MIKKKSWSCSFSVLSLFPLTLICHNTHPTTPLLLWRITVASHCHWATFLFSDTRTPFWDKCQKTQSKLLQQKGNSSGHIAERSKGRTSCRSSRTGPCSCRQDPAELWLDYCGSRTHPETIPVVRGCESRLAKLTSEHPWVVPHQCPPWTEEIKVANLCFELGWWLESSILVSEGQERDTTTGKAERGLGEARTTSEVFTVFALAQSCWSGSQGRAQALSCLASVSLSVRKNYQSWASQEPKTVLGSCKHSVRILH